MNKNDKLGIQTGSVFDKGYGLLAKKVLIDPTLTIEAKAIYSYLVTFAGNSNQAFPSVAKITHDLNISKDRYYNHMDKLIKSGYIRKTEQRVKGKFARNTYEIIHFIEPCPDNKETVPCPDDPDTDKPDTDGQDSIINRFNSNSNKINNKELNTSCQDSENPDEEPVDNLPKFDEESMPYKAACHLRKKILANNSRTPVPKENPADMEDWSMEMDRLNRLGPVGEKDKGYSWDEIRKLIDWCQDDTFWRGNILSASKFRKQIIKLENKMNQGDKSQGKIKKQRKYKYDEFNMDLNKFKSDLSDVELFNNGSV